MLVLNISVGAGVSGFVSIGVRGVLVQQYVGCKCQSGGFDE